METGKIELSARQEDYIEAIFHLSREHKVARSRDISAWLGVDKSSVTGALQGLAQKGIINYSPYEVITLTDEGMKRAGEVVKRHIIFRNFLTEILKVAPDKADEEACRLEHAVSDEIINRFAEFIKFFDNCPGNGVSWQEDFGFKCRHNNDRSECSRCRSDG